MKHPFALFTALLLAPPMRSALRRAIRRSWAATRRARSGGLGKSIHRNAIGALVFLHSGRRAVRPLEACAGYDGLWRLCWGAGKQWVIVFRTPRFASGVPLTAHAILIQRPRRACAQGLLLRLASHNLGPARSYSDYVLQGRRPETANASIRRPVGHKSFCTSCLATECGVFGPISPGSARVLSRGT